MQRLVLVSSLPKQEWYEVWAWVSAGLAVGCWLVVTLFLPWVNEATSLFCAMFFIPLVIIALCCAAAVRGRLPLMRMGALILLSFLILFGSVRSGLSQRLWDVKFGQVRPQLEAAVEWARQQTLEEGRSFLVLPKQFEGLASNGRVQVHRNDSGGVWYSISIHTHAIDNAHGFAFSETAGPPPRLAYPGLIRSRRLRDGWWWFSST